MFGALYQNGQPQADQLTFVLGYQLLPQSTGLIKEGFTWIFWFLGRNLWPELAMSLVLSLIE